MTLNARLFSVMLLGGAALVFSACGPTYPKCENDEHCSEKGEFCVNGLCQQCRDNSHCEGAGQMCSGGKCVRRPGYCDETTACPGNQKCRDNECGAECLGNDECGAGKICQGGSCVGKPDCGDGADNPACPDGQECLAGRCQVKIASFNPEPVYFDFDKAAIRADQKAKLTFIADHIKKNNAAGITIEGHADERGTDEYNLALSERRAQAAKKFIQSLGIAKDKLSTLPLGEERPADSGHDESSWSRNRRAEFVSK